MAKFYLFLWLSWTFRVVLCTLFLSFVFAFFFTFVIYIKQGLPTVDTRIANALFDVWKFWFFISINIALLIALFRSVKYLFNTPHAGYILRLKKCLKENEDGFLESVGYGDLVKVWRKWFMLLIWLVGAFMVIALGFTHFFTSYESLFGWFSIYILYLFIFIAGYFSFIFLMNRCKTIRIVKC